MISCPTSTVGPGCGTRWTEIPAVNERGLRYVPGSHIPCSVCGGWYAKVIKVLEVKHSHEGKGLCRAMCQTSESNKCGCVCKGKMHGAALDPFMVYGG